GWRTLSQAIWHILTLPVGITLPDYAANGLTVFAILVGFAIRSWRGGHQFYGFRLALSIWPYSKEFDKRDGFTALAVWTQLIFSIAMLSLVFRVNMATETIPRDAGHDVIRALVGFAAVVVGCFPRAMGSLLLSALVLIGCDVAVSTIRSAF